MIYRGSMAGLCVPLSTLRPVPRGTTRMTRGQHDSLLLCCEGLSPFTPYRFLTAHWFTLNRLAEEERLRSSRPRRTRYSALQAHHRMRHESACAGATKDPSVGQCVCAEHNVRSWHAGVGEDLRSAGNRGRHNLIPIYATTPGCMQPAAIDRQK